MFVKISSCQESKWCIFYYFMQELMNLISFIAILNKFCRYVLDTDFSTCCSCFILKSAICGIVETVLNQPKCSIV